MKRLTAALLASTVLALPAHAQTVADSATKAIGTAGMGLYSFGGVPGLGYFDGTSAKPKSVPIAPVELPYSASSVVNVRDFGADPTQVSDSTQAFQNAVNYACTKPNGHLYMPGGYYVLSATVNAPCSLVVSGDGALTELRPTGSFDLFTAPSTNAYVFQHFTVKILSFTPTAGSVAKIGTSSGQNTKTRIDNVYTVGMYRAFDLEDVAGFVVSRNVFTGSVAADLLVKDDAAPDAGDSTIIGNTFIGNASTPTAVDYQSAGGIRILDNKFLSYQNSIWMRLIAGVSTSIFMVQGNSIEQANVSGVRMEQQGGSGTFIHALIQDNQFGMFNANEIGVYTPANSNNPGWLKNIDISGNNFRIGGSNVTGVKAVDLESGTVGRVHDNVLLADSTGSSAVTDATGIVIGSGADKIEAGMNTMSNIATPYANNSATSRLIEQVQTGTATVTTSTVYGISGIYRGDSGTVQLKLKCSVAPTIIASPSHIGDSSTQPLSASGQSVLNSSGVASASFNAAGFNNGASVSINWLASCF